MKIIYLLQLRKKEFTRSEVMGKTGLNAIETNRLLRDFASSGMLKHEEKGKYVLLPRGRVKLTVVLTGGVYDGLHRGHLAVLTEARTYGDVLVVVVATDTTVKTLKGHSPVFPEDDRRVLVEALKPVDAAILGYTDVGPGYGRVIDEVNPNVIALGYDQAPIARAVTELIEKSRLNVRVVLLSKFDEEGSVLSSAYRVRFDRP